MKRSNVYTRGFTIVELLIVIVVIGVLATIVIISYNGISNRAKVAAIQSDVENASKTLSIFKVGTSTTDQYPTANDCSATPAANTVCLKTSGGNTVIYQVNNSVVPAAYCVMVTNGSISYEATNDAQIPTVGSCPGILSSGVACASNYIVVPGNSAFGTSDFCVMKYEARNVSGVATSQASGTPWVSIAQPAAITAANAACSGCHLITDPEWLTIAANVMSVKDNWSGGAVGSGFIYSGHNDNSPSNTLAASTDDNGYSGTGNTTGSSQRRTLILSNGEVIWDFAGNIWEITSATLNGGQLPGLSGDSAYAAREYNNPSLLWNGLPAIARPANVYSGAGSWSSTQGIGMMFTNYSESTAKIYLRGGSWDSTTTAGVLALRLNLNTGNNYIDFGFRVAK